MEDVPGLQDVVERRMQAVVDFALEEYGIAHTGEITINIAPLDERPRAALPGACSGGGSRSCRTTCSFQEGAHLFIGPQCRSNKVAYASEWFARAVGTGEVRPTWVGHGVRDYFANHYAHGEVPEITEDRFRRALFYERPRTIRQDQASDDLKTLVMLYALEEYGEFADWLRFYGSTAAGLDAGAAFESVFEATLAEFYDDFEEWANHQKLVLFSTAFSSCLEASRNIRLQGDPSGHSAGYPDYRVPLEIDHDDDGIVCEGFQAPDE